MSRPPRAAPESRDRHRGHGRSSHAAEDKRWRVRLARVRSDKGCGWGWIQVRETFASEPEAREWIKANAARIEAVGLYHFED